jgi:hypothetical protein
MQCIQCEQSVSETRDTVLSDLRTPAEKAMIALKMLLVKVDLAGSYFVLNVTAETILAWLNRAALFFYRDQQNREVDFLWSSAGHLVLLEAKWTETIRSADTSAMDTVAHVFTVAESSAYRVKGGIFICRTPEHFAPAAHVRVVNGFRLREAVATL